MNVSKSYEEYILGLYGAMLSDMARIYPGLRLDFSRDYKRLISCVDHHGLHFIMDTLNAFGKHFDQCLAKGSLTPSGLAQMRPFQKGSTIPRLFKGLLLQIFYVDGALRPDVCSQDVKSLRQLCYAAKSFRITCSESLTRKSLNDFYNTDREVVLPSLDWNGDDFDSVCARHLQLGDDLHRYQGTSESSEEPLLSNLKQICDVVQRTADLVCSELGTFKSTEWRAQHGPGAVSDTLKVDFKYHLPGWTERLDSAFPYADLAFSSYSAWADHCQHEVGSYGTFVLSEPTSKMIAVPKTLTKPRLIASEPVAHQWCQQTIRDYFVSRVKATSIRHSIAFHDQTRNGNLALESSHTGSHATLDLSEASDRISCYLVERIFRNLPTLLQGFYASRTRVIRQDISKKQPEFYELRKFSTMGSAVTFPIQTVIFTIVACGTLLSERGLPVTKRNLARVSREVRVFGDDSIVPIDILDSYKAVLTHLGLKVNVTKTFGSGKFRESCGIDAYDGHIVTPVKALSLPSVSKPEAVLSSVDTHNNFFLGGWYDTCAYIRSKVAALRNYVFPEVMPASGAIGWYTHELAIDNTYLRDRWNPRYQVREVQVTAAFASSKRTPVDDNSSLLQFFTECWRPIRFLKGERLGKIEKRDSLKLRRVWVVLPE